ncbi:AarF/ABC1/UbiB kinase family protein [Nostocoides sp. F2B08]|uniref:ABC1 kinase family protein n=1 Tax=Nostocoides sp. F2B08 TaxID=2653936 RepID=UPI001262BBF2|nr:AarF/UbiB family protein [Tetrasphaera sp. F2B08]KAB7740637.1 AarF/ABC1/UbiB kinase family protein [Tetrasphaera sp. F2B08]
MKTVSGFVVLIATLLNAAVIGLIARRLIAVPVGWPRTIALAVVFNALATPVIASVGQAVGAGGPLGAEMDPALVAVVILVIAWLIAAQVVVLVILEALVPTGSLPSPIVAIRGLPARYRRTRRYAEIVAVASRHGLGGYLRRDRPAGAQWEPPSRVASGLREALTDGGVTFVKLGQVLSTRPDILPPAFITELSRLHASVPAAPWSQVRPVIEDELERPIEEVFAAIDEAPLAAASVAQIHLARLHDGREVVVKVQRPSARREVTADLDIVLRLADRIERTTAWGRSLGVRDLARGFSAALAEELDYRVELANMRAVAAQSDEVAVPTPYPEYSTRRLLVMDRLAGAPLSSAGATIRALPEARRRNIAQTLLTTILGQLTSGGVFHADLHAGNILITESGDIGLLDFGSVGRLDRRGRESFSRLLLAVEAQDAPLATDAILDLLIAPSDLDDRALERQVGDLLVRHGGGLGPGGTAQLVVDLMRTVVGHGLTVPPQIAAAFRALGALEGSLQLLDPGLDLVSSARRAAPGLLREQLTPETVQQRAIGQLAASLPMLERLPRRIDRISSALESGDLTVRVRAFAHPDDRSFLTRMTQQIVVALLAGALAIAGTVLVISDTGLSITDQLSLNTFLGFVLLLFAFVLGSRLLALVFYRDTHS